MRRFIALLCLCLWITPPLLAQERTADGVSKADIVRLLGRLFESEPVRADLVRLGFKGENLELAVGQVQRMMNDPKIAGYIADQVLGFQKHPDIVVTGAQGLLWQLIDRGITHVPLRDLRYYHLVAQTVLNAMPIRECGLAVKDQLSPRELSDATSRVAAKLNTPALREYYRIQIDAARFGTSRAPRSLSASAQARIEEIVFKALVTQIAAQPDSQQIMAAFGDLRRASNRHACAAGRLFNAAVLSLEGRDLRDALILISTP